MTDVDTPPQTMKPFHPIYFLGTVLGFALLLLAMVGLANKLNRAFGWSKPSNDVQLDAGAAAPEAR